MITIIKLISERLVNTGDFRLRDTDVELRISVNDIDDNALYILVMNETKRFTLTTMSNLLIWTLPVFQNETISIAIECKRLNTGELLYTTNDIVVKRPELEDSYDIIDMFDEHRITQIIDRNILLKPNFAIAVEGDKISQLMEFQIARYYDGIDRLNKKISIIYVNASGEEYTFDALNISKTDDKIRFNWLLEDSASVAHGTVSFKIQFSDSNYLWQTSVCEFKVLPTLDADKIIVEKFPSKLEDLSNRVSSLETSRSNTDDITLSTEFKVIGTSVGALEDGDIVEAGNSLTYLLDKIRSKTIPPTYIPPTLSIDGSIPTAVEIGSNIMPTISPTFKQNNAGGITNYTLKKNNSIILNANNIQTYTDTQFQITGNTSYGASVSFGDGIILNDNIGNPSPEGRILAGMINSNTIIYSVFRNLFYGTSMVSNPTVPITSYEVRGLSGIKNNPTNGTTVAVSIPIGTTIITFAYPDNLQDISSVISSSLSMDVKNVFIKTIVNVNGANGYTGINYKIYTYIPAIPFVSNDSYVFTI